MQSIRTFSIIWFGQFVSLLGTGMTRFALLIWAYQQTEAATTVALLGFFSFLPFVVISPFAGVIVDRFDRRVIMLITDTGAGLMTILLLVLFQNDHLLIWHLYVAQGVSGLFEAFQAPAYGAAASLLIPKQHYTRANGLRSIAENTSTVVAPFAAGALLAIVGIRGILLFDVLTFLTAVFTLLIVRVPRPAEAPPELRRILIEIRTGFGFIFTRPGLIGLLVVMMGMNFFAGLTYYGTMPAMILAKTQNSEISLAIVQGALGIGGIVGGVLVAVWGGPKRNIHGVLGYAFISFLLGDLLFAMGRNVPTWALAGFIANVFIPFIVSANHTIWQLKTPPVLQGRVFAAKNMLQIWTLPVGYLLGGPLADRVFEPAMTSTGTLAAVFGPWVGTGPGAGIALMFMGTALLGAVFSLCGYLVPAVRGVEDQLPDHDAIPGVLEVRSSI